LTPADEDHGVEGTPAELRGERAVLRPLSEDDVTTLVGIGAEPGVARWWPGLTADHLATKAHGEDEGVVCFAVVVEGQVAGLVQYYEEDDPEYRHAGIDLFLGSAFQGQGLGTDVVRTVARHLVVDRGHHRLVIDPAAGNERAIRCYERVGFRRVGVMRQHWRGPDGVWQDGVLLDLLAAELA
jgi:aminoglycoside 6'-N-acetyltransferase